MGYTVIDLGSDAIPSSLAGVGTSSLKSLSDAGDVSLASATSPKALFLRIFDGVLVDLPPQIGYPTAIATNTSGDRLVIGSNFLFSVTTGQITPIVLLKPNQMILAYSMNIKGDIAGMVVTDPPGDGYYSGFILNWSDKSFILVPGTILVDLGDTGSAAGMRETDEAIAFFDGANVTALPYSSFNRSAVCRINNRAQIAAEVQNATDPSYVSDVVLYDIVNRAALMTFPYAKLHGISDLGVRSQVLWTSTLPPGGSYLNSTPVSHLFPPGSGLVEVTAVTDLNRNGMILGRGLFWGSLQLNKPYTERTFLLVPDGQAETSIPTHVPSLVATILAGVINDSGGWLFKGGQSSPSVLATPDPSLMSYPCHCGDGWRGRSIGRSWTRQPQFKPSHARSWRISPTITSTAGQYWMKTANTEVAFAGRRRGALPVPPMTIQDGPRPTSDLGGMPAKAGVSSGSTVDA
jgi:hypothetical protein